MRFGVLAVFTASCACGGGTDRPAGASDQPPQTSRTYHADARVILASRCVPCHQPSGAAPSSLATYDDVVAARASAIGALASKNMPPFPPDDSGCEPLADFRKMSDDERATMLEWLRGGAPEGDPASAPPDPPPPPDVLGLPSDVFDSGLDYTSDAVDDEYRCFVVDPKLTQWTPLRSAWVVSSKPKVVHHAVLYAVPPERAAALDALDAKDATPGYPCYGGSQVEGAFVIGGYAPGAHPGPYPDGTAIWLAPGTKLVAEMHYHAYEGRAANRMKVQAWRASGAVKKYPRGLAADAFDFVLPAGAPRISASVTADVIAAGATPQRASEIGEGLAWSVSMHMHLLGKSTRVDLLRADGSHRCLLNIPSWSDHWQGGYAFAAPVPIRAGDRIEYRCEWDNSAANQPAIDGAKQVPREVRWGFGVRDEMCSGGLSATDP